MFADDIVICSKSREQLEENLERWRYVLERRGVKVRSECMCVNGRKVNGTVKMQGAEAKKVQEFNCSEQWGLVKRGKEESAVKMEWKEKSALLSCLQALASRFVRLSNRLYQLLNCLTPGGGGLNLT